MTSSGHAALLVALSLFAAPSTAQPQLEPMRLDLADIEVDSILNTFARVTGSRLEKHPGVEGSVSFRFDGLSWRTALTAICESAGCTWQLEENHGSVLRVRPASQVENPIDLSLVGAPASQVFAALASIGGHELELDPDVDGKLTFTFNRVSVETALDAFCENLGCEWRTGSDHDTLRVRRLAEATSNAGGAAIGERLQRRIDLDLVDAAVVEVLESLARVLEVEADLDEELRGEMSVVLDGVSAREALDLICDQLFLRWSLVQLPSGGRALRVRPQQGDFGSPGFAPPPPQ